MIKVLEQALAEVAALPESAQERIGRELLAHVERLHRLRSDITLGLRSLDERRGRPLVLQDVLKRARRRHTKG